MQVDAPRYLDNSPKTHENPQASASSYSPCVPPVPPLAIAPSFSNRVPELVHTCTKSSLVAIPGVIQPCRYAPWHSKPLPSLERVTILGPSLIMVEDARVTKQSNI